MAGDRLNLDATRSRGLPISGRGAGFFVGQFTGRTGAAPAALRRRGGPQPGSLDGAHRSGRASGYHQDPPTTLLLPRRTADPLGPPPHFASSPALALGSPVQWRPGTIASPSIFGMTAATSPLTPIRPTERPRQLAPTESARGASCLPPTNSARHGHRGPPSSGLCGHLTPPSSPSIGIGPGPFAFPYPSSLVSTTGTSRFGGFGLRKSTA